MLACCVAMVLLTCLSLSHMLTCIHMLHQVHHLHQQQAFLMALSVFDPVNVDASLALIKQTAGMRTLVLRHGQSSIEVEGCWARLCVMAHMNPVGDKLGRID